MRIVPGSCAQQLRHVNRPDDHNLLTRGQTIERPIDDARAEDIVLTPGQMSLLHVLAIHGSGPNTTDEPRVGIAIRYLPTYVRQSSRLKDSATLVCCVDRYGHFEAEQRPKRDFDRDAFDYYQHIVERHLEILMTIGDP
jgi:ectoine hydroxylase-related dioxygenase (phytanoyl-CoA dioxygenase family)